MNPAWRPVVGGLPANRQFTKNISGKVMHTMGGTDQDLIPPECNALNYRKLKI